MVLHAKLAASHNRREKPVLINTRAIFSGVYISEVEYFIARTGIAAVSLIYKCTHNSDADHNVAITVLPPK